MPFLDLPRPRTVVHISKGRTQGKTIAAASAVRCQRTWSSHRLQHPGHTGTRNLPHTVIPVIRGAAGAADHLQILCLRVDHNPKASPPPRTPTCSGPGNSPVGSKTVTDDGHAPKDSKNTESSE